MAARHIGLKALLQLLPRGPGSGLSPSLPGSLQLVSWLSSGSNASSSSAEPAAGLAAAPQPLPAAPLPSVDAVEIAKALRCQQFYEDEIQTLRALKSSLPHDHLLDFMRQRCERRQHLGGSARGPCSTPAATRILFPPSSLTNRGSLRSPPATSCRGFTPAAAEDVIGRLERSGALLNIQGTVLLRPGEVAQALALVRTRLALLLHCMPAAIAAALLLLQ